MKFDFDTSPERRGTASYKWDSAESRDIVPLWVADMDFRTAPAITEALHRRVDHGVFGYVRVPDDYYEALTGWFCRRHNWHFNRDEVIYTSGVVPAISAVIKALCHEGDGVVLQTPVYNCFFSSVRNNGCHIIDSPLLRVDTPQGFTYRMDFEDLERCVSRPEVKAMLLCNPHNPAGRCWSENELRHVAHICSRHGVVVVSDEIHCELTMPGHVFTPFATVAEGCNFVVCNSPSKAFNTAGLQIANIICPDPGMRRDIDKAININEVCDINPFGVEALKAAYNESLPWLEQLIEYLHGNYMFFRKFMSRELPKLQVAGLEATYLAWVDITPTGIKSDELEKYLLNNHQVWVNAGEMYGSEGFIRINLACPRSRLAEGLRRMAGGIKTLL